MNWTNEPRMDVVSEMADTLTQDFLESRCDQVYLVYNEFVNVLRDVLNVQDPNIARRAFFVFDQDGDGAISKEEFSSDEKAAVSMRKVLQNTPFATLDADSDGALTREDFRLLAECGAVIAT